jgi:hypothetical protein
VVEMAEVGPELVYPPSGDPYLVAQHGLVVADIGSYVSPAPATRGQIGGMGGGITININAPVFGVDDLERHLFSALARAASVGVPLRRIEVGMR